ncbi:hypothetical protein [Acinetobacter lwoffii]|nr:hypothetical protein [Acinetobacter lwoffii]ENW32469.1 hypothetical protein F924_00022 [Acinetobacter lwoffii ATCC 9957 = CIP 70.31]
MDRVNFAGPVWSVCVFARGIGTFAVLLFTQARGGYGAQFDLDV